MSKSGGRGMSKSGLIGSSPDLKATQRGCAECERCEHSFRGPFSRSFIHDRHTAMLWRLFHSSKVQRYHVDTPDGQKAWALVTGSSDGIGRGCGVSRRY